MAIATASYSQAKRDTVSQAKRDTVYLTLPEAEKQFLSNNLQLMVQKYSIDSAKANVITARLYDNPEFSIGSGFYQPERKKFFDYSDSSREIAMQLSQLIRTAGKRNKAIRIAETGVQITQYQFYDLLRTLRFTLRDDFYNIYYLQASQKVYNQEIQSLKKTAAAFEEQAAKGNIARTELLRIKSQLYSLQAELVDLQNAIDVQEQEFKLLLRTPAQQYIVPQTTVNEDQKNIVGQVPYQSLLDSAYRNRYDFKIAQSQVTMAQQNLKLQKALAVPDVTAGLSYDRLGSYVKNFNSLFIGLPLPIFNRNQGGIRQAKAIIESNKLQLTAQQDQLESQVSNSYVAAQRAERLLNELDPRFPADFEQIIQEVFRNYEKRNISLLEFIDFYDSYKTNVLQLNNLRYNRKSALEQLNFATGTLLFP